jgi:menaquinone-9 beta-reductase
MRQRNLDVVIVGGRVAGASLAIHLARAGRKVVVVDRASFPSGTTSTHVIYPKTIANLDRLGVLDRILAHRPPPLYTAWYHQNRMFVAPHSMEEGRDWAICVRRVILDTHLLERAKEFGVEVQEKTVVTGIVGAGTEKDPVRGVTAIYQGKNIVLEAPLVVGADGANSTVARLVGAEKECVMPTRTMLYYAYWTNADSRNTQDFFFEPPWICAHFPADDGHHVITMNGPVETQREIKNLRTFYRDKISSIPLLWSRLKNANQVSDLHGSPRLEGFYRRPTGPGWLLTGDAVHFKHPASAQGIGDALEAAEALAPMILHGDWRTQYPEWLEGASREFYAFCEFLADIPTDEGMRRTIDVAIHDPSAARAIVDIWSRSIRPWEALSRVPAMLEAAGNSPEEVLAKYERGTMLGPEPNAQQFVSTS